MTPTPGSFERMGWTSIARRVVVCHLLLLALAVSGLGWTEAPPETRAIESAVTLTGPPGLAIEAALRGRSEVVSGGWADQRLPKARVQLALAVLVALTVLPAAAIATLTRPSPAPRSTLWRRWSVALRAPPVLRLS